MKVKLTLLLLLICSSAAFAQFGLTGKYWMTSSEWAWDYGTHTVLNEPTDLTPSGWSVSLDYWFRLKNKRIEFLPELNLSELSNSFDLGIESKARAYSFFFNVNLYLWDLAGDCDCPTFSKQGPTLAKGLFVQLSPGVSYWDMQYGNPGNPIIDDQAVNVNIGGGLGFDIGITDLITLTPVVNLRYYPKLEFGNNLAYLDVNDILVESDIAVTGSPLFWNAGLRLGLRLDE